MLQKINKRWSDLCVVAASGPSLVPDVAEACRGCPVVAVNDAYRLLPFAEVLYSCDARWWDHHRGCPEFGGEKWSSHGSERENNKIPTAQKYGLNLVRGRAGEGFSLDPAVIHYGSNSGFQGINLAIHKLGGVGRILLVGFDMRMVGGKRHFFGDHPSPLKQTVSGYASWPKHFDRASEMLPPEIKIINCTAGSALRCFEMMDIRDALPAAA